MLTAHIVELATVCNSTTFKAKLGVGAEETLMVVLHWPEDGAPDEVAAREQQTG